MSVRAKFQLNSYTTSLQHVRYEPKADGSGPDFDRPVQKECRTLNLTPVKGDSPEDKAFWDATPTGSIQLGTVNPEAWKHFEIGKTYYVDFTPVEK